MGKVTGFLEFKRAERKYAPVAERVKHTRDAHWEEKMALAETDEELRDIAREMLEKIDDGFFDDDGGEARRKRRKMN